MSDNHENRRNEIRNLVVVPVLIDTETRKERLGVTHDVSRSGTLLLSKSRYEVGEKVQVMLYTGSVEQSPKVDGVVLRVAEVPGDVVWRYAMAVRFESPLSSDTSLAFAEKE